jgi:lipid-A-disaccharide synthase
VVGPIERRVLIVAGEPSGDAHAASLVAALRRRGPCRLRGVAGPGLRAAGVEPVVAMESLAVLGFVEIVARLPVLLAARARLLSEFERFRPQAVVLVDYPGFNLRLGPELKLRGARIFYYIAPQVWAWHPGRAGAMARWVERLAVVFPFEEEIFRAAGVPTTFVGHPLLDGLEPEVDEATFRAELGLAPDQSVLGLLPGSREQEVRRLLAPMCRAAARLVRDRPRLVAVVAAAPGLAGSAAETAARHGVRLVERRTRSVQRHATACAVASGTATLETALFGTPLVVVFRTGRLNYAIARRLVRLRHIGLPNIVAGAEVAAELIQGALTPEALAGALAPLLDEPAERARRAAGLAGLRERLGGPGASERAAGVLWEMLS